ncbi:MAG TPA: pyridoxamine 5'-phosphate oxidase family protein [Candidatus Blautia ornithocaccae]|nr:pyridoxamine 5'-phosphate oxidase family protein [Candidatus Blautia ornithocaccae]
MSKVVEFLQANPVQYLATVGRDNKAKVRPFMFLFEQEGKLWFCTNNTKDVYKDMQANPEVEVCVSDPTYAWIRIHGTAVFEDNMAVKEGAMNNPIVKGQYETADNPIFEVFYIKSTEKLLYIWRITNERRNMFKKITICGSPANLPGKLYNRTG